MGLGGWRFVLWAGGFGWATWLSLVFKARFQYEVRARMITASHRTTRSGVRIRTRLCELGTKFEVTEGTNLPHPS